jgi:PAS domain S-box-containing protein
MRKPEFGNVQSTYWGSQMKVIDTLEMMGNRLQIAIVVCDYPQNADLVIRYANTPASLIFGYIGNEMCNLDIRSLMPKDIATEHRSYVTRYTDSSAEDSSLRTSGIMGSWRNLVGVRKDGSDVHLSVNVADIKNSEERYFVALFIDRTTEVCQEAQLKQTLIENESIIQKLNALKDEAEDAKLVAEDALLQEKKLTGQITLLKQIFTGTVGLISMLGILIITSWVAGINEAKDSLAMIERVLLVLTGILGSAMASVFDSRNNSDKK